MSLPADKSLKSAAHWCPRHVAAVAIGCSAVPALLVLSDAAHAVLGLLGWSTNPVYRVLGWFPLSAIYGFGDQSILNTLAMSRWPIMLLLCGLICLSPRAGGRMLLGYAYLMMVVITILIRWSLFEFRFLPWPVLRANPELVPALSAFWLTWGLTQAVDLLIPALLLIAKKMLAPAEPSAGDSASVAETAPIPTPIAAPLPVLAVLAYRPREETHGLLRRARVLCLIVAGLANLRFVGEVGAIGLYLLHGNSQFSPWTLPLELNGPQAWMRLDALAECLLRVAWLCFLIGVWCYRRSPATCRRWLGIGLFALIAWCAAETCSIATFPGDPNYMVAGHQANSVHESILVGSMELTLPLLMLLIFHRGPDAPAGTG